MNGIARTAVIFLSAALVLAAWRAEAQRVPRMHLDVDIDVGRSQINGGARMDVSAGQELIFFTGRLSIHGITVNGTPLDYEEFGETIKLTPAHDGELAIRYSGIFRDGGTVRVPEDPSVDNVIDERGVSLTNIWYPSTGGLSYYELRATFPDGYIAVSEADVIGETKKNGTVEYRFSFPYPVEGINLVASDKYVVLRDEVRGIGLYAYFFREDRGLAETYLEFTKKYIEMYEDLVGMYPYRRFSVVENFLPTGYSMPTYTLLGSTVVKLPFIVKTSLGHEILHQWFGNSVYIDYSGGNWAEGLTTYLADHLYREAEEEGWQYRKQLLVDYLSYVDEEQDLPLRYFTGRIDRPSRAIGYGKTAMVFHMLKNLAGEKAFYRGLRDFIDTNRFRKASWDDMRVSFEKETGEHLEWFFSQWTEKEGLLELTLYGAELRQSGREFILHFHIDQEGSVFRARVPLTVYFKERAMFDTLTVDQKENSFDLVLQDRPGRIVLDEDYDLARGLSQDERPPVIGRLLGDKKVIIALPLTGREIYDGLISEFERDGAVSRVPGDITFSDMEEHSLIILGADNPVIRRLTGSVAVKAGGLSIVMKENPWNPEKVLAVVQGTSREEVDSAVRKIPHYGKYSTLRFSGGVNTDKEIEDTKRGMVMDLEHEATAIELASVRTLSDVVNGIRDRRIVYVGEVHDVFAHHAVQLDIITGLYRKNAKIAIGMEMFQRPFQKTLDSFIQGKIGEVQFLRESEYFRRWGFDYMLYKPILDFARTEKIPVVALNLEREIIERVSSDGMDALSDEEKAKIPPDLDFSDREYRGRLREIFTMHARSGEKAFDNFYQSQILWDETMSRSVDEFLRKNSDYSMVVLAGQGHLEYGSGIPKRTFRRNGESYAIVLIDENAEKGIGDYVVFPKPVEGITTPKLMAFLTVDDGRVAIAGFPEDSVSEKAGLQEDDIILSLDDTAAASIDDIRIHLLYKEKGDIIRVRVLRTEDGRKKEMTFDVAL